MSEILIKTENLTRVYTNRQNLELFGLKDININISKGEFLSIMGPSGAGKTTLFNLLGLLDRPDWGSLFFADIDLRAMSADERAKFRNRHMGLIFQQFYLIPNLTIYENAIMPWLLGDRPTGPEPRQQVESLFERFGLTSKKKSFPNELSGGEQQRAAIIRALANDPQVILADEPTGNLDSQTAETICDFLMELNRTQGRTVLFISHNRELALKAHRVIYLKDGEMTHEETR